MGLEVDKRLVNNKWLVKLSGEIDIYTANSLKESINNMTKENLTSIEIDAQNLDYIDSTGLGVLVNALKKVKEEGNTITLYNIKNNIQKLLEITGLNKVFIVKK